MKISSYLGTLSLLLLTGNAIAATEYLRFEGAISTGYDEFNSGYDAALGFTPGQTVYFDFQIDTALNAPGYPDSSYQDNFEVTYLDGTLSNTGITHGVTSSFPEGTTSWLFISNSLFVGSSWDWLMNPSDESINTWGVGDHLALMNNSYFSDYIIGSMELTHRSSTALPAYVPLPAAVWLFVSGLLGFIGAAKITSRS